MIFRDEVTGVILCGGGARRMHGAEKPLLDLAGIPLVSHVRERLAPQVSTIIISANRELERYAAWGDRVVTDDVADGGPLFGVRAALAVVETPYLSLCPGDAPLLDRHLVTRMGRALVALHDTCDVVVPHDGTRAQHLFAQIRVTPSLIASLDHYLAAGHHSAHGWLAERDATSVDCQDIAGTFANVNTEDDLQSIAASIGVRNTRPHEIARTIEQEYHSSSERL